MGIYVKTAADEWTRLGAGKDSGGGGTSWGDFTTNGDADVERSWTAPDSQGRIWKYAAYKTAGDYTINLTGGMYWILATAGGSSGWTNANIFSEQGQAGVTREGYWEFPADSATQITVGRNGTGHNQSENNDGMPSSIGNFSTGGNTRWGERSGRGAVWEGGWTGDGGGVGYKSFITGIEEQYSTGHPSLGGEVRPGQGGTQGSGAQPGCVIIATVDEDKTDYYEPGALPGVSGWATITGIDGSAGTRYQYGDWVAYEWTADGELTTQAGGLVDALIVGGGGGSHNQGTNPEHGGLGGNVNTGIMPVDASNLIVIGESHAGISEPSLLGQNQAHEMRGIWISAAQHYTTSAITGQDEDYGIPSSPSPRPNKGDGLRGTTSAASPSHGVVIVRVPKAHAYLGALPAGWVDA